MLQDTTKWGGIILKKSVQSAESGLVLYNTNMAERPKPPFLAFPIYVEPKHKVTLQTVVTFLTELGYDYNFFQDPRHDMVDSLKQPRQSYIITGPDQPFFEKWLARAEESVDKTRQDMNSHQRIELTLTQPLEYPNGKRGEFVRTYVLENKPK